ncbi:MFS general substrate transporter [Flagelloscypha sp. PMI_526]|nr:MFS general substrate transporter [Flagelloscypha sp. PMI_526]
MSHARVSSTNDSNGTLSAPLTRLKSVLISLACTGTLVTQLFGSTSVAISLPSIGRDFDVPENQLQWLVSAYALSSGRSLPPTFAFYSTYGCLLLFFGRIADLYGRKKVFTVGLSWTLLFSLGCGFANNYITLAILRAMQGLGLAAAIPSALGILAASFKEGTRARSTAFATFSAGAPLGSALGGVIGGLLIESTTTTWRSPFYLTAGIIAVILTLGLIFFENDPPIVNQERLDWLGAFLITSGLVLVVFVLGQGEIAEKQWKTPCTFISTHIIALLILGVIFIISFGLWERRLEHLALGDIPPSKPVVQPLLKMSLFRRGGGRYALMMSITFLEYTCFMSWYFWMQIFYQDFLGLSPLHSAIRLLAMPVTGMLVNVFIALVVGRIPIVWLLAVGAALTSTATILFATMQPFAIYWHYQFPALIVSVWGADFVYAVGALYVAKLSEGKEQSVTGGLFQTMTQIGAAFGVTITTVVFNRVNGSQETQKASLEAYQASWWTSASFGAFASVLSILFFRKVGIVGHKKQSKTAVASEEKSDSQS